MPPPMHMPSPTRTHIVLMTSKTILAAARMHSRQSVSPSLFSSQKAPPRLLFWGSGGKKNILGGRKRVSGQNWPRRQGLQHCMQAKEAECLNVVVVWRKPYPMFWVFVGVLLSEKIGLWMMCWKCKQQPIRNPANAKRSGSSCILRRITMMWMHTQ